MPVHLYGLPADMRRDLRARRPARTGRGRGRRPGARRRGRRHAGGRLGTAGCFSFYPTKNMHSLEGGMVTTADAGAGPDAAAAAQPGHGAAVRQRDRRRQHADDRRGRRGRPRAAAPAGRLDRAAPGQRRAPRRRAHAASPRRRWPTALGTSTTSTPSGSAATATPRRRNSTERGHRQRRLLPDADPPAQARTSPRRQPDRAGTCPETERAAAEVLSLPVHPSLTEDELQRVVDAVNALVETRVSAACCAPAWSGSGAMGRNHARVLGQLDGRRARRRRRPGAATGHGCAPGAPVLSRPSRSWSRRGSTTPWWPARPRCTRRSACSWPRPASAH